jgi:hypothetical protein
MKTGQGGKKAALVSVYSGKESSFTVGIPHQTFIFTVKLLNES